jgi:phage tail sheath protein FI
MVLWPSVKIGDDIFAASAIVGALIAYTDANNEDVPSVSPSNERLAITGTCLADGTEVTLDQDQANTVNGYGVTTAINLNGWRLWGNYTGAYPSSTDAKDIWFAVRRMFNWQGNNFLLTYFDKVDDPMNFILIESIVDSENIRCGAYAPDKWAGAYIEYLESDNPITDILAGKMTFRQHIAPYTPAQEIDNILSYDTAMLQSALLGGE